MNALYHAHSGLRYLVLLAGLSALVALGHALTAHRTTRASRIAPAAFNGLLDLQVLLGIGLVVGGIFPDRAIGHLASMVLALVSAHGSKMIAQRAQDERRELLIRFGGVVVTFLLIAMGIMAIGRSVLGSTGMTVG